jgi:hypothetical protein
MVRYIISADARGDGKQKAVVCGVIIIYTDWPVTVTRHSSNNEKLFIIGRTDKSFSTFTRVSLGNHSSHSMLLHFPAKMHHGKRANRWAKEVYSLVACVRRRYSFQVVPFSCAGLSPQTEQAGLSAAAAEISLAHSMAPPVRGGGTVTSHSPSFLIDSNFLSWTILLLMHSSRPSTDCQCDMLRHTFGAVLMASGETQKARSDRTPRTSTPGRLL